MLAHRSQRSEYNREQHWVKNKDDIERVVSQYGQTECRIATAAGGVRMNPERKQWNRNAPQESEQDLWIMAHRIRVAIAQCFNEIQKHHPMTPSHGEFCALTHRILRPSQEAQNWRS